MMITHRRILFICTTPGCFRAAVALLILCGACAWAAVPTHRYSFDVNADDSVGSAHGILLGNAIITNGVLILNGTDGCVQLPGNMFTNSKSLTMEIWFSNEKAISHRMLWAFPGSPGINFTTHANSGYMFYSRGYYGSPSVNATVGGAPIPLTRQHHLVWTQDGSSHLARIYLNGQLYAENNNFTATPGPTTTGYLGAQGLASPIAGNIAEFRTYSNALSHLEVLQSQAAGPEVLSAASTPVTNLTLRMPLHLALGATLRPKVFVDFDPQQHVEITPLLAVTFTASDTNVIFPTSDGYLKAAGLGVTEITAAYGGISNKLLVTVVPSNEFALAHRYDFDGFAGSRVVGDRAGGGDGIIYGGGGFTNGGQLYLNGYNGYVELPAGLISNLEKVTVEAWVTRYPSQSLYEWWPRVFDFGSRRTNGGGLNYIFLSSALNDGHLGVIRFAARSEATDSEAPQLTIQPWETGGVETHFAVTYDPERNTSKLYTNGVLAVAGIAPMPLDALTDTNNWLGRSQFTSDTFFTGLFNEVRIYRAVLDDAEIAASYISGTEVVGADYVLHARRADANLSLSWGPSVVWGILKTSHALGPAATWTTAAATPVFTNGHYEVSVPLADERRFFYLSTY